MNLELSTTHTLNLPGYETDDEAQPHVVQYTTYGTGIGHSQALPYGNEYWEMGESLGSCLRVWGRENF